jgi:hypothetical protein
LRHHPFPFLLPGRVIASHGGKIDLYHQK